MITGHVFLGISLDGFVARADHTLDWLMKHEVSPDAGGYNDFIGRMDGLIMGSGSFQTVLGFGEWPYSKPVVVLSQRLSESDVPHHLKDKIRISKASPEDVMLELAEQGWTRAYVDGGAVVRAFLQAGLIQEMTLTIAPILIGQGISLFGPLEKDIDLELVRADPLDAGLVQTVYRVK